MPPPANHPGGDDKALFLLDERVGTEAAVRAIVAPRIGESATNRLAPISAGRALAALAPSSILQLGRHAERTLTDLRDLCATVPAFELQVGADLGEVPALLMEALT